MASKTEKQNLVDNQLRVLVESLESLDIDIETLLLDWDGGMSGKFADDSTPYDDGRVGLRQFDEALIHTAVEKARDIGAILLPLRQGLRKIAVRKRGIV